MSKRLKKRLAVASWLNQDVEHDAVLIDGAPQIVLYAPDPDEHLVQVPLVTRSRPAATHAVGKALAKFLAPASNGLIGDDDTSFCRQKLNISQAEAENVKQSDSMADDFGGKAMAVVWVRRGLHAAGLVRPKPDGQTRLP